MNKTDAKELIKRTIPCTDYLEPSKNGMYCCPFCESGHGHNGTGAVKYFPDTNTFHCFACGDSRNDVIDLYQAANEVDYETALHDLADRAHITLDESPAAARRTPQSAFKDDKEAAERPQRPQNATDDKTPTDAQKSPQEAAQTATAIEQPFSEPKPADYTQYYKRCTQRLLDPAASAYLNGRGISVETAMRFWIGFDPQADPAKNPGGTGESVHPVPRIIIPTTKNHYVGRSIDPNTDKNYKKMNSKGSKAGIFNIAALYSDAQTVFITEGAFDALSIIEAGSAAVALNSTSNVPVLLKDLEEKPTTATLVLCCDNDDAGKKANGELREGLRRLNISFIMGNIYGGYKDPNEFLQIDREKFLEAVEDAERQAAARPDNVADYITQIMGDDIENFKTEINTGFANLDAPDKSGGLYAGLYTVAAISSLGKTTFCAQMADQIAAAGHDVLFFSLEQSRLEMVTKSLARITAQDNPKEAVTSLQIRKGYGGQIAQAAARKYVKTVGNRLSVIEGNFNCNLSFIGDYIRQYIRRNDVRPVIFIDYLQILQPEEINGRMQTTKDVVDVTVTECKRLSRELNLTIFLISSVNRANYLTPIDFESLKESGGIEFTCDVVWGLQLKTITDDVFVKATDITKKREMVKDAKAANPRKIKLVCLKNRYGIANYSCSFDYYPANDLFKPAEFAIPFEDDKPKTNYDRFRNYRRH